MQVLEDLSTMVSIIVLPARSKDEMIVCKAKFNEKFEGYRKLFDGDKLQTDINEMLISHLENSLDKAVTQYHFYIWYNEFRDYNKIS